MQMKSKTGNKAHASRQSSPAGCPLDRPPAIMQHQQCFGSIDAEKIYFSTSVFQANRTAIVSKYISKYKLLVEINIFSCYPLQTFKTITQLNLKVLVHRASIQYSFPLKSKLGQIYHTFGFTGHSVRKGYKLPRERKSGFRPASLLLCGF